MEQFQRTHSATELRQMAYDSRKKRLHYENVKTDSFTDTIPRRNRIDLFTPAEKAIYDAMGEVEKAGADTLLTEAVILLQQAMNKVSDFVDGVSSNKTENLDETRTGKLLEIYKLLSAVQGEQIRSLKNYIQHLKG